MKNAFGTFIFFGGAFAFLAGVAMGPLWGWGGIAALIGIVALVAACVMQREVAKSEWKRRAAGILDAAGNQVNSDAVVIVTTIVAILGGGTLFLWSSESRMSMSPKLGLAYSMGGIAAFMAGLLVLLESRTPKQNGGNLNGSNVVVKRLFNTAIAGGTTLLLIVVAATLERNGVNQLNAIWLVGFIAAVIGCAMFLRFRRQTED